MVEAQQQVSDKGYTKQVRCFVEGIDEDYLLFINEEGDVQLDLAAREDSLLLALDQARGLAGAITELVGPKPTYDPKEVYRLG